MRNIEESNGTITIVVRKTYLFAALALIIGFGAGFGVAKGFFQASPTDQASPVSQRSPSRGAGIQTGTAPSPFSPQIVIDGRPYSGPDDAPVTLVEFTDFQCSFCERHFRQTLPSILSEYEGRVKYVVLNYPVPSLHPFAQKASEAAECAYDQGKYWEYHAVLFQSQQALGTESLKRYALELGLDTGAFDTCLDSGAKAAQVLADFQVGQNHGVTGTPTFFINGAILVGAQPFSRFQAAIDEALGN